jgi:hypothetical protein
MITRTFKTTTIKAIKFELVNGKPEQKEVEISILGNSTIKESKVNQLFNEQHGKAQYLVTATTVSEKTRAISDDDFIKYSKEITRPDSQKTELQKQETPKQA